ncbi:MAG: CoA pyrophosphatase [Elusimicrobiota bacterium]|nr:CoA pyrophosphatase [Elusimicrobiota bacterium]
MTSSASSSSGTTISRRTSGGGETLARFAALKDAFARREPARIEEPGSVETSVSVILSPGKKGLDILLIRRAEREGDPWSGHIGLPGGRREPGDKTRLQTAVRETLEEVRVKLPAAALLGELDDLHPRTPSLPPVCIRPFVFGLPKRPAAKPSAEVAGCHWLPLAPLLDAEATAEVVIRGEAVPVPCLRPAPDLVVWGLTYRILRGLSPLL